MLATAKTKFRSVWTFCFPVKQFCRATEQRQLASSSQSGEVSRVLSPVLKLHNLEERGPVAANTASAHNDTVVAEKCM